MHMYVTCTVYLVQGGEEVDYTRSRGGMESGEQVSECDLVLCHEVVHHHLPFPERGHAHHEEVGGQEEVKDFLPPGLPGDLEPTEGGQQLGTVEVALLVSNAEKHMR